MNAIASTSFNRKAARAVILPTAVIAAAVAGCGGGGGSKSLESIQSCLKGKHFTVTKSKANPTLKMTGFLTANDADLNVLTTIYGFEDSKSANSYYRYLRSTHDNARLKGTIVLSGKEKGAPAKKLESCL